LPEDVQNRIEDKIPEAVSAAGALIITPKLIAKASTSRQAMDALAGLAKASQQPKIGGAVTAKIVDQLNKSGIIDVDYINEVNAIFNPPSTQQPTTPSNKIDLEEYLKNLEQQQPAE
jgi:hypothetical protein